LRYDLPPSARAIFAEHGNNKDVLCSMDGNLPPQMRGPVVSSLPARTLVGSDGVGYSNVTPFGNTTQHSDLTTSLDNDSSGIRRRNSSGDKVRWEEDDDMQQTRDVAKPLPQRAYVGLDDLPDLMPDRTIVAKVRDTIR
jgi:hypothetical protein